MADTLTCYVFGVYAGIIFLTFLRKAYFHHAMLISFVEEFREHQIEFDIGVSQINCWISVAFVSSCNE